MQMLEVVRYLGVERRRRDVDHQGMMTRIRAIRACRRYPHSAQAEMDRRLGGQGVAVLQSDEVHGSSRGGWRRTAGLTMRRVGQNQAAEHWHEDRNQHTADHRKPLSNWTAPGTAIP